MTRTWPFIAVADVPTSATWYSRLLNAENTHPGSKVFDQIVDSDGTTLLCLHHWGPSGLRGDHRYASLADRGEGPAGNGLLLWFVVDDFDATWARAQEMGVSVEEAPNSDNGTLMRAFVIRDQDGYYVAINEARM